MPIAVADLRRALGGLIRQEVKAAAGDDRKLQTSEHAQLTSDFVKGVAARSADGASVDRVVDAAMSKAMRTWAKHNQATGRGAPVLSKKEINKIRRDDPALGVITGRAIEVVMRNLQPVREPVVSLKNPPAGLSIEKNGDVYTLMATQAVPVGKITLTIDGHDVEIERYPRSFGIMEAIAPEGYGLEYVGSQPPQNGVSISKLRVTKDPPGTLTTDQAQAKAKEGLVAYLKNERIHDDDWKDYFPTDFDQVVADGALDEIDAMLSKRDGESLGRTPNSYLWVGRGPYGLYTEVEVRKNDGKVLRAYVEID